jgi:hypothetical protein
VCVGIDQCRWQWVWPEETQCSLLRLAEPQPRRLCDLGHPRSQHLPPRQGSKTPAGGSIYVHDMRNNNERKKNQLSR